MKDVQDVGMCSVLTGQASSLPSYLLDMPRPSAVLTGWGGRRQRTRATLTGVSLANDVDAICRFAAAGAAGSIVRAEWLSDSKVRPKTPAHPRAGLRRAPFCARAEPLGIVRRSCASRLSLRP